MRVYIRPLRESDALVSYTWRNDPEVWRYTASRPDRYITPEMEVEWIRGVLKDGSSYRFAICADDGVSDQYVGNAYLTEVNAGVAWFHIFIGDRQYWGRGIASEATRMVIAYAFNVLEVDRVRLRVKREHAAAISVYQRCGFAAVDLPGGSARPADDAWQVMEIDQYGT